MVDGQKIVFSGEGDQAPDTVPGDVIIVLEMKEHATMTRKGRDLYTTVSIDLITALAGGQFSVTQLDGRILLVTNPAGTVIKPGESKCILGEGMPAYAPLWLFLIH